MNSREAQLISLGLEIQLCKNKEQNDVINSHIKKLEEKYYDLRFEINREDLEDKFIENMIEKGYDETTAIDLINYPIFNERCYKKCTF